MMKKGAYDPPRFSNLSPHGTLNPGGQVYQIPAGVGLVARGSYH
jgi:hypothetical protein